MCLVPALNQLGRNADAISCAKDTSFQNIFNAEFATDLPQILLRVLIPHRRSACNYAEPLRLHAAQFGDHFLSHAVAEVLLLRIGTEILEGQNGKLDLGRYGAHAEKRAFSS